MLIYKCLINLQFQGHNKRTKIVGYNEEQVKSERIISLLYDGNCLH